MMILIYLFIVWKKICFVVNYVIVYIDEKCFNSYYFSRNKYVYRYKKYVWLIWFK